MTGRRQFTLVELLVVIGIIIVLAALIIPAALKLMEKAMVKTAIAEMTRVLVALDEFYEDYEAYPSRNQPKNGQTRAIVQAELDSRYDCKFYVEGEKWLDPWNTEIYYALKNAKVMLVSYGPDTVYDTDDDITVR